MDLTQAISTGEKILNMWKLSFLLISIGLFFPGLTTAESVNYAGYIDGSYNYLARSNQFTSGTFNRAFDLERHGLTLHQAALTLSSQPKKEGFGGLVNLIVGRDANTTAAYGWKPKWGTRSLAVDPLQAYFQGSSGSFTLMGGKFVTLAGYEVVNPTQDTNFSRSILWGYAEPATHTGFRGIYSVTEKLNLTAGINNGWDSIRDTSRHKTLELCVTYTFNPMFSLGIVDYLGEQRAADRTAVGPKGIRNLIDIAAILNVTDRLTFVANFDHGRQSIAALPEDMMAKATWVGIAGYMNYKFSDCWRTSIRGEIFDDKDGYRTGVRQVWKEITLTLGYAPYKNLEFKAEIRRDFSNMPSFVTVNGQGVSKNQQSIALEAFYKFP